MAIQGITAGVSQFTTAKAQQNTKAEKPDSKNLGQATELAKETEAAPKQDGFVKGETVKPPVYTKNQLTKAQVSQLQNDANTRADNMAKLIQSMVVKQGQKSNLTLFGQELFVSPEQSAKAAASIAEGGEYSVDSVAGRIMDMAKALSGGDKSKIAELRDAVEKGFKAAGVDFGGSLPSISQDTHTEVMNRFDEWQNEGK